MRPVNLQSKIFLDGGDPEETRQALNLLGFLDGQTTNPSLVAKNPEAQARLQRREKFTNEEILQFYKKVVRDLSQQIPGGSISIEVYADSSTSPEQMISMGKEMATWIPNAHIKLPTNTAGLTAAQELVKTGVKVNLTLCFTQEQAAAVYAATLGGNDVFVSPFVGRLDDRNENGMDLVKNILNMYETSDHHTKVVVASVRNLNHFLYSLALKADIITTPFKVLKEWADAGMQVPDENFVFPAGDLKSISYQDFDLTKDWHTFNTAHELTDIGIEKFASDWNGLIS